VRWLVDDTLGSNGVLTGPGETWNFTWNLGVFASNPFVYDGVYLVTAQAFDSRGVPGDTKVSSVLLNRQPPIKPDGFEGGYNQAFGVADLRWSRNPERDIVGYRVYRGQTGGDLVCDVKADQTSCFDDAAGSLTTTYRLHAIDKVNLADPGSALREGAATTMVITLGAVGDAPPTPLNLSATLANNLPKLSWDPPAAAADVSFYRIYRDTGTGLADRYDVTFNDEPSYVDPDPGATTQHKYWITAVDSSFNESAPSDFVVSPPFTP